MPASPCSSQYRTWITCGAYAMLHALQAEDIDLLELENSTGVTFGAATRETAYHCTRMLTPFRTFWEGMLPAARLWGITIRLFSFPDLPELRRFLEQTPSGTRLVLGPVSMAGLQYLPLSSQYRGADHYIALRKEPSGQLLLTDSEGITGMFFTVRDLAKMCTVKNIPEAAQMYTVGAVVRGGSREAPVARLRYIVSTAEENFRTAEQAGQGSRAILRCLHTMETVAMQKWRQPVLYDLSSFLQRKDMLLRLAADLAATNTGHVNPALPELVDQQMTLTAHIRRLLSQGHTQTLAQWMEPLAELEQALADKWKEWIQLL